MATEAQTSAQASLTILEERMRHFDPDELAEIETIRDCLRTLVHDYGSSAELAIIAVGLEIAIKEKQ